MKENGFEYVDLGLPSKTMWATCNVGATKPEDQGLLFQFGRVDGYKYGDENHQFRTNEQNKKDTRNDYIPKTTSCKKYNICDILDLDDDAAHVNMGGKWKMPTNNQLNELLNNTTYEVVGVQGMMFTSKINNKQLFIPFMQGSWCDGNWHTWSSGCAIVWSSQVAAPFANFTVDLVCYCHGYALVGKNLRSYAFSVRGVFKK